MYSVYRSFSFFLLFNSSIDLSKEKNVSDLQVRLTSSQLKNLITWLLVDSVIIILGPVFLIFLDPGHVMTTIN